MKPPMPDIPGERWTLVDVDPAEGSPFDVAQYVANSAAAYWMLSKHGPYAKPEMTPAEATAGAVREALLHLVELGLVDLDVGRLNTLGWWPADRDSSGARSSQ